LLWRCGGQRFKAERTAWFGCQGHVDLHQSIATRDQHRNLVARLVLIESRGKAISPHSHVINGENLVVHVEAGIDGRRAAPH
jgi:hypothetical protein